MVCVLKGLKNCLLIQQSNLNPETSCSLPTLSAAERFIQKVLKNVGRQHVDVDDLTPHDLDQLSRLIVDALQVVDQDQAANRGLFSVRPRPRDLGERDEEEEEEEDEDEEKLLENAPTLKPQDSTLVLPAEFQGKYKIVYLVYLR